MTHLQRIELDDRAFPYVRESLHEGGGLLSRYALDVLPLEQGRCQSWVEEGIAAENAYDFSGMVFLHPARKHFEPLEKTPFESAVDLVYEYLQGGRDRVCVVDDYFNADAMTELSEQARLQVPPRTVTCGGQVYRIALPGDSRVQVRETLGESAYRAYQNIFLSHCAEACHVKPGSRVSPDILRKVADNTSMLLCLAYDEESFVIWTRRTH